MAFFKINDFSIRYELFDHRKKENILFIHGNLASSEWWYPSIELMKAEKSMDSNQGKLLCADWRGYGKSKGLNDVSQIDFNTFAQDYILLLEELNLKDVTLVGHSTGGFIAMLAILKAPHLFKNLILLDSVGPKGLELQIPKDQVLAHFEKMQKDSDYSRLVLAATIHGCDPHSQNFSNLFQITRQCDPVMWQGVIEVLSSSFDLTEKFKQIDLPTLILHGEKDLVLPISGSEELATIIKGSKLQIVADHGHSLNMEDPDKLVLFINEFLKN